jgi:hypothetical protein
LVAYTFVKYNKYLLPLAQIENGRFINEAAVFDIV